ncbi:hypothetical protein BKN38_00565 [Helicobacter sp. CLO-3]|nr:hypothetical protein BKN38_00565 [Helicobacter sp. CLO-3]
MFNINLLNNLRFYPTIHAEDTPFGIILFAKAKQIKLLNKQLYIYRIRANSNCEYNMTQDSPLLAYPPSLADIAFEFRNRINYRPYYYSYSSMYASLGLLDFMQTLQDNALKDRIRLFIINFVEAAFEDEKICHKNPRHTRELLKPLKPYMQKVRFSRKMGYYAPWLYRVLKKAQTIKNKIKSDC